MKTMRYSQSIAKFQQISSSFRFNSFFDIFSLSFSEIQGYITHVDISNTTNESSTNDGYYECGPPTDGNTTDENSTSDRRTSPVQNIGLDALRYIFHVSENMYDVKYCFTRLERLLAYVDAVAIKIYSSLQISFLFIFLFSHFLVFTFLYLYSTLLLLILP